MTHTALKLALLPAIVLGLAACNQSSDEQPSLDVAPPPTSAPELPPAPVVLIPSLDKWTLSEGASFTEVDGPVDGVVGPIYKITLAEGARLFGFNKDISISAGDTITARFTAWADEAGVDSRFRIARYCGGENNEQEVATRNLGTTPTTTQISHTFEFDQPCARFQIDSRVADVTFYVAEIEVSKAD